MNLEYNSGREALIIPEYGRHVQNLVEYAMTIEDATQRQLFVEMIINLMYQIVPASRQSREVTERLWNHVLRIADYKLDVKAPEDVLIVTKEQRHKPHKLQYPKTDMKYRNHGYYVQQLVEKGSEVADPEKRKQFAFVIGSYMKMAARTWSHDQSLNDEVVKNDLRTMSNGKLDLDESVALDYLGDVSMMRRKKTHKALSPSQQMKKKNRKRKKRF
jgi:Domain of unknown function (DUF4290)